ncbi:TPR-like protein [Dothidotthia symphoricarpi CBS 119687]|uniref:TPR-like protein n=1 Tax=Dothidotthia symphoricarpi CBS 119687 TaxID=1392245 RepID=A0A6A5ZZK9_9PLEO|nr:TPR-like protein [Dothidotthia symphoricarpi CBS 119687]KAF2124980.1 TPR-like protein [Dothidotthia symphoricarpi CBS 119687]
MSSLSTNMSNMLHQGGDTSTGNQTTLGTSQPRQERLSQVAEPTPEPSLAKRDPQLPCFSVPVARNLEFFGRTDVLDKLEEALCPPENQSSANLPATVVSEPRDLRTFAICGSGGVGKTQTATQFVHKYKDDFDAIFWLHAEEPAMLEGEFAHIAVQLNLVPEASQEANNLEIARGLVKGWLAKPLKSYNSHGRTSVEEASWLIVFDNVANTEALLDYWPEAGSSGSILLTSRDPLAKSNWYKVDEGIDLREFNEDEASAFLLKNTWRENDDGSKLLAHTVVKLLGYHPLAIVQMASVMVREQLTYKDFIQRYEEEAEHAELFEQTYVSKQKQQTSVHTISSVWLLDTLDFGAGLLHTMSFFDPDGIQDNLLTSAIGLNTTYEYLSTKTKYQKARAELLNSSLISKDASGTKLMVHRLTQDAVWASLADLRKAPSQAVASFNSALAILLHAWPRAGYAERQKTARWNECEVLLAHILRLRNRFLRASPLIQGLLRSNIQLADLLNEFGWYCQERARNEEATECFQLAQANLTSILEVDSSSSLTSPRLPKDVILQTKFLLAETHRNLGCSAAERIRPVDARFHFKEYNKLMLEEYHGKEPNDDSRLAISYFELATAHIMLEEWSEAEECNIVALKVADGLTDSVKAKMTRSLPQVNLACLYLLTGRVDEAEPLLVNTLREREEIYGVNHTVSMITGRVYHGLGWLKQAQGKLEESHDYQVKALEHMKKTAGPYHHRTADMYFKVAQHLVRLDRKEEALKHLESATNTYNSQACYCAERGRVLFWQAKLLTQNNEPEKAKEYSEKALQLYREARSTDSRPIDELTEQDFDRPVIFWSR